MRNRLVTDTAGIHFFPFYVYTTLVLDYGISEKLDKLGGWIHFLWDRARHT